MSTYMGDKVKIQQSAAQNSKVGSKERSFIYKSIRQQDV